MVSGHGKEMGQAHEIINHLHGIGAAVAEVSYCIEGVLFGIEAGIFEGLYKSVVHGVDVAGYEGLGHGWFYITVFLGGCGYGGGGGGFVGWCGVGLAGCERFFGFCGVLHVFHIFQTLPFLGAGEEQQKKVRLFSYIGVRTDIREE